MSRRLAVGLALACLFGALAAWLELRQSDEARIETLVGRLIADADRRDFQAMAPWISERYHDGRGLDRPGVLAALGRFLHAQPEEKILPLRVKVGRIENGQAEVSAKVILASAEVQGSRRRARDAVEVDLVMEREGGAWKVLTAEDWEIPTADATMLP
ncbi:MAG: hypothetical protein ACYDCL_23815 [Myxococcales bacterium]